MEFWITLVILIAIAILTYFLINFYAKQNTPLWVRITAFSGWFGGFLLLSLIPYDIFISRKVRASFEAQDNIIVRHSSEYLRYIWESIYWVTYVLCWTVLPIMMHYLNSGEFSFKGKMRYAIRRLVLVYSIGLVLGLIFLCYLFIALEDPFYGFKTIFNDFVAGLKGFLVAIGNTWGLFLIIFFLGNGLIEIPRNFLHASDKKMQFKRTLCKLAQLQEENDDNYYQLTQHYQKCRSIAAQAPPQFRAYSCQITDLVNNYGGFQERTYHPLQYSPSLDNKPENITYKTFVDLKYELTYLTSHQERLICILNKYLDEAIKLEEIFNSMKMNKKKLDSSFRVPREGKWGNFLDSCEWFWYTRLSSITLKTLFVCMVLVSFGIVLGECTLFSESNFELFGIIVNLDISYISTFIFSLIPLFVLAISTYYGIFNFKLSRFYGLYPHNQTDPSNLIYSAIYVLKLAAPLAYNFLLLMKVEETTFQDFMGLMHIVPIFGLKFQQFFPCTLLVFCFFNFFNIFTNFMTYLGLENYTFYSNYDPKKVNQGKIILRKEKTQRHQIQQWQEMNSLPIPFLHSSPL